MTDHDESLSARSGNSEDGTFRDRVATIDDAGKRKWIYPKKQGGKFHRWRTWMSWGLLAFLLFAPFIKFLGEPLLLFNVLERKFIVFGLTFWPQDFYLFVLAMIAGIVFIFLFTAVYGRLFCGWICPQTIFMEMVFRKIEYAIDGSAKEQRALTLAPWTGKKIAKRMLKHGVFYAISFFIGNIFLAYIIGAEQLYTIISEPLTQHVAGLTAMLIFSGVFYFIFAWFREQVCTLVCPYGRLQSVLLDENSIVISYDYTRGEPREKFGANTDRKALGVGDCINCRQCVAVCPTGIDIRNGTQLECINCTACIDACDEVMTKVNLPTGLIRYTSSNGIISGSKKILTPRVIGYSVVLSLLICLIAFLFFSRDEVETTILRTPGTLFEKKEDGSISNLYTMKVVNKGDEEIPITLMLLSPRGKIVVVGGEIVVPKGGYVQAAFFVACPSTQVPLSNNRIRIGIFSHGKRLEEVETSFMGPGK